jgi:chromosome segregation ATPase
MNSVTESIQPKEEPTEAPAEQDKLVPVTEAIRYRKRAQAAEQQLGDLQAQLNEAQQRFEQAEQTIDSLERRQRIDALLAEADAIDVDAARLLTEAAVQTMDEPDVAEAVQDLRRHKPYLFHPDSTSSDGLALAPQIEGNDDPLAQAAEQAQHSGDRRDLLRYLRLRRRP